MKKTIAMIIITLSLLCSWVHPVQADGIIIPEPIPPDLPIRPMAQLEIKYHHVTVSIDSQIATTHVDQVFHNPNDWPVEGTYVFPVPADAVISEFLLWMDGEPVEGIILNAEEARQTYEQIVREMQDPALLEYVGLSAVQARVFPIAPGESRRFELEYQQVLTTENGLMRYTYPLNTEKFSAQPLESVKITVEATTSQPVRAVYSPTHPISISKDSIFHVLAGYEQDDVTPDKDFALFISTGESEALHLFSYRDPDSDEKDGYFLLLLAPSPQQQNEIVAKDVLLILDRSGSMEGEKFHQAQKALVYILDHLNPEDRFFLTAFSTGVETFSRSLESAEEAEKAISWALELSAAGSTDINRALLETVSMADPQRPTYIIFLTDGLPTEGITDSGEILSNLDQVVGDNIRLFPFGVGYDVDTFLLDTLSKENHGLSTYVLPGEPLDEILSSFYNKISTPVLTDIELAFTGTTVYDLYPQPLPDLFEGSQILVTGRYRDGGNIQIELHGMLNGVEQVFRFDDLALTEGNAGESSTLASLPRLWATRKIGFLLNKIRLQGPDQETIDQIINLSIRHGIVTPYTSYLVTEPMPLGAANQQELARDVYEEALSAPAEVAGQQAVEKADDEGQMYQAEVAPPISNEISTVKSVWSRTFVLKEGTWLDTAYDPEHMKPINVAFLSEEYFQLSMLRPDISAALALGNQVLIVIDGEAYQISATGESSDSFILPDLQPLPENTEKNETENELSADTIHQTQSEIVSEEDLKSVGNNSLRQAFLAAVTSAGLAGAALLLYWIYTKVTRHR